MIVHRAFTSGVTPVLICVYTLIGRVARRGPLIKILITTSSMDIANARSDPDITAGIISGRMMSQNIRHTEYRMADQQCQHTKRQIHHIEKCHQYHTENDFRNHERKNGNIFQNAFCFPVDSGKADRTQSSDHCGDKAAYHTKE